MTFARWVYRLAGIYGLLVVVPLLFSAEQFGIDHPPLVTHREFYFGFVWVVLAWQIAFLVVATDPVRYRPLMPVSWLEKFPFTIACAWLYAQGELPQPFVIGASLDFVWGVLFVVAWLKTPRQ